MLSLLWCNRAFQRLTVTITGMIFNWGRKKRCIIVLTNPAIIVVFSVGGFVLIFALCAAMFIKLYSPGSLSFVQALLISGWSIFVSTVLVIVFTALKPDLKPAPIIDGLSALILLCLSGVLITRQARKYGVGKIGLVRRWRQGDAVGFRAKFAFFRGVSCGPQFNLVDPRQSGR